MQFWGLPLDLQPVEMMAKLESRGLNRGEDNTFVGRVAGLDVQLRIHVSKDTASINNLQMTTRHLSGHNQRDDYATLMKWMRSHYGSPTWESTVRGHAFARWYIGFDRDIVMIATASSTVDVWFYNNHRQRNIDYYSILKYCERNPSDDVPFYTARECVTWRSTSLPVQKKTVKGKGRTQVRRTLHSRAKAKSRHKAKRRRRR